MKNLAAIMFVFIVSLNVSATEQDPDLLLFAKQKLTLNTGWGHPSPLQTYYFQNDIRYPFIMLSTANYRGHIATWVIQDDKFYLKEIEIKSKVYQPHKFGIKSKCNSTDKKSLVFADWFSGIVGCYKTDENDQNTTSTFYFHIRYGKVISWAEMTNRESLLDQDSTDKKMTKEDTLSMLHENYISYYYRLNNSDVITYNNRECQLSTGSEKLSPIYAYYSKEHLKWPFNWENLDKSGAPHCTWKVVNDSLKLTDLQLYRGLSYDSIDTETVTLNSLFTGKVENGEVFANWVSGVHLIIYGVDTTHRGGYKEFKPKEYTYCSFEHGKVKETFSLPADFDFEKYKHNLDPRLKRLMKDY